MSFYLTLSTDTPFVNSSFNDFTTILDNPLNFDCPYEVALVQIKYPVNYKVSLGKILTEPSIDSPIEAPIEPVKEPPGTSENPIEIVPERIEQGSSDNPIEIKVESGSEKHIETEPSEPSNPLDNFNLTLNYLNNTIHMNSSIDQKKSILHHIASLLLDYLSNETQYSITTIIVDKLYRLIHEFYLNYQPNQEGIFMHRLNVLNFYIKKHKGFISVLELVNCFNDYYNTIFNLDFNQDELILLLEIIQNKFLPKIIDEDKIFKFTEMFNKFIDKCKQDSSFLTKNNFFPIMNEANGLYFIKIIKYSKNNSDIEIKLYDRSTINDLIVFFKDFDSYKVNYDEIKSILQINNEIPFTFDSKLETFFNKKVKNSQIVNIRVNKNIVKVNNLLVFCDIIEDQIYNRGLEKILKTIKTEGELFDVITKSFLDPEYIKVNQTFINSIKIIITDQDKNDILFTSGPVILKLHFRRAKHEFLCNPTKRRLLEYFPGKHTIKFHHRAKVCHRSRR